jgi:hypothetical protein
LLITDIPQQRLQTQRIEGYHFKTASDVVGWFGAVQSQDFANARWGLGLRSHNLTDKDVEQAYDSGEILRTHVLRPTWHFVVPADIRWLLALTGPRVNTTNGTYYRKFELDDATTLQCHKIIIAALEGGKHLTRVELSKALKANGIASDNLLRVTLIVMRAELDGIICNGPMRGKQFTYALIDEWVPATKPLTRDEALADLTLRYFTAHGPATVQDCVWWSGLTAADIRLGLELVGSHLLHEEIDGQTYWFAPSANENVVPSEAQDAYLLPNFDEFTVGYRDRSVGHDIADGQKKQFGITVLNPTIVVNHRIVGTWKRTLSKDTVQVNLSPFDKLTAKDQSAVDAAAERFGQFVNKRPVIETTSTST